MLLFGKISPKQVFFDAIDDFHSQNRNEWRWVESPYFLKTFPEEDVISLFKFSCLLKNLRKQSF